MLHNNGAPVRLLRGMPSSVDDIDVRLGFLRRFRLQTEQHRAGAGRHMQQMLNKDILPALKLHTAFSTCLITYAPHHHKR